MRSNVTDRFIVLFAVLIVGGICLADQGLQIENGWFEQDGRVIWGCAQHNGWWGGYRPAGKWMSTYKVRTAICRNAPGQVGPSLTEDLDKLTDAMVEFGYPGFEHNYGLWYDRRRDGHDDVRRTDPNVVGPFLEQPWARSGRGQAWDGLTKYDLTKFNRWYFDRLKKFASLCREKRAILFHNFYMQHTLLELQAHYADFPWRPVNCIQDTGMPDTIPAANAFYDISDPRRRKLHTLYIRKCLDELGDCPNVVHLISEEYTGPLEFMRFWLDTIKQWQKDTGKVVKVGLVGTKDVVDAVLNDPDRADQVCCICVSGWWYRADGSLNAPPGGKEVAGRYTGNLTREVTPASLYRQIAEYRRRYPDKAIVQHHTVELDKSWAFLAGGGSMIIARMQYADSKPPKHPWDPPDEYIMPPEAAIIKPTYDFINQHLSKSLLKMRPVDPGANAADGPWCLSGAGQSLVFTMKGSADRITLANTAGRLEGRWFNPANGALSQATPVTVTAGGVVSLKDKPEDSCVLWLKSAD